MLIARLALTRLPPIHADPLVGTRPRIMNAAARSRTGRYGYSQARRAGDPLQPLGKQLGRVRRHNKAQIDNLPAVPGTGGLPAKE